MGNKGGTAEISVLYTKDGFFIPRFISMSKMLVMTGQGFQNIKRKSKINNEYWFMCLSQQK